MRKIENIIEEFSKIKSKYLEMELNIKKSLDDYYGVIREAEYKMKEQFNSVWDSIVNEDNQLIQYTIKDDIINKSGKKVQNILDKILSKFDDNFRFVINENEDINILYKMKSVCIIIIYKLKIVVRFMNYDMTLTGIEDKHDLLDAYLSRIKMNI
jgi:hypothetical protein